MLISALSSVLEALTEIPFPRNDNLCTRFATEIILRRGNKNALTIKVIPDPTRPVAVLESIRRFKESITDFEELPRLMNKAMEIMGIESDLASNPNSRAFAKDVLSIEIEGPTRPQLTLVDLPGLIQTETKGVTKADVSLVAEITDHYISQPRTICLAVVAATTDYANQGILTKVRKVDPKGERTLGIVTKPDRLPAGSGSEKSYIDLAGNQDVFFKLGWHVIKNRAFEETSSTFLERNASEAHYFSKSNFKSLPKDCVGIDSLRKRLSHQLFEHVKQELPRLREDLDEALSDARGQLKLMGGQRTTAQDCKAYLTRLSQTYFEICKAAVDGHYEGNFFTITENDGIFSPESSWAIRRLRALVQYMNTEFANKLRLRGHKYHFTQLEGVANKLSPWRSASKDADSSLKAPIELDHAKSIEWVNQALMRTRGRELSGNFNPLLVGELFWEQSSKWNALAADHAERVAQVCREFLNILLNEQCPDGIRPRLMSFHILDKLKIREQAALDERGKLEEERKSYPVNYNHYYTDTIKKRRQSRLNNSFAQKFSGMTANYYESAGAEINFEDFVRESWERAGPDMVQYSGEEALDCLYSIYKVSNFTPSAISRTLPFMYIANMKMRKEEKRNRKANPPIYLPVAKIRSPKRPSSRT